MRARRARQLVKRALPRAVFHRLNTLRKQVPLAPARLAFATAPASPEHLGREMLERLAPAYTPPAPYAYSADAVLQRGRARAKLLRARAGPRGPRDTLELGCWDGMVSAALGASGSATAIDLLDAGFDARAREAGVRLMQMDAEALTFEDASFDLVFSFDTFEHFPNPERVLAEAIRVLRPRGRLYLEFGPLYPSPRGLHAYRTISLPYCQHLFEREVLDGFVARHGAKAIAWDSLNRRSVSDFRALWRRHAARLRPLIYEECVDISGLDLNRRNPSCFRTKVERFDDLVVSSIVALFERAGGA